jgi:thioredoxin reductase (NADPH)
VCHRGEGFDDKSVKPWLLPEIATFSKVGRLRTIWNVAVERLDSAEVHLRFLKAGSGTTTVKCDGILLLTGYEQEESLFERVGISLEGNSKRPVHSAETMETNVAGIYVIGTCVAGTEGSGTKHFIENSHPHVSRLVKALGFGNISERLVMPEGLLES